MKKLVGYLTLLIIVLSINSILAQNDPNWKWIHPKPQGQFINWFKMINANVWLAAGDYGSFLKTTDAGVTWKTTTGGYPSSLYSGTPIYTNFKSGWFFDQNNGLLGTQASHGIVKTTNGGLTFDTIYIPGATANFLTYKFSFLNSLTGYLVGTTGIKGQKTTNGGLNWTPIPGLDAVTTTLYSVCALDVNNIFIGTTAGNIYKTTDAGANWFILNVGTSSTHYIYDINFVNSTTGYLCGPSGFFRYTTDGGNTWSGNNAPASGSFWKVVASGTDVYCSGPATSIFKTTDNGNTWSSLPFADPLKPVSFSVIYGFDKIGSTMLVAGTYGLMNKSTDNGVNWTNINYVKGSANLIDIYAQNGSGKLIAIGSNAGATDNIMYSGDGGSNWSTASYTSIDLLANICMLNPSTGFICGHWGEFIKTTNSGTDWDASLNGNSALSSYFLNGLDFINETTGWVVGGLPSAGGVTKIWKTLNGGVNWTEQTSAYSGPIAVRIKMVDANTGFIVGQNQIQKTTNGGINWVLTAIPVALRTYNSLKVFDANNVYISADQVYTTTNGGTNWVSLNFPVNAGTLFTTDWYDSNNGVVGGVIGVVGKTTNKGQTWQIFNVGGYTIMSAKMVHPDTIFAVAGNTGGAEIFKYIKGTVTSEFTYEHTVPVDYDLKQNYPNPFNPTTTIEFDIVKAGNVSLKVYDITGREYTNEIRNLMLNPGSYKMNFNGSELSSGIYFYSLVVNGINVSTRKMSFIK
ncbi:MAG: YCF48-related protein [Ignavibacteria bacterium]